jgi:hypothetical protein
MINIRLISLTEKGKLKIAEHLRCTTIKDRIYMRSLGIRQVKQDYGLSLEIGNKATELMELYDPENFRTYVSENIINLVTEIEKMGIKEDIDFKVEDTYGKEGKARQD